MKTSDLFVMSLATPYRDHTLTDLDMDLLQAVRCRGGTVRLSELLEKFAPVFSFEDLRRLAEKTYIHVCTDRHDKPLSEKELLKAEIDWLTKQLNQARSNSKSNQKNADPKHHLRSA